MGDIDKVTWYAMGMMLTGIGLVLSYLRYKRKGVLAGVRGVAWSLIPLALALTGTLKLAGQILDDVGYWATHLVFSPVVWLGLCLAGLSAVLFGVSGWLAKRAAPSTSGEKPGGKSLPATSSKQRASSPVDDDMADIEAILRKHGIQ